MGLLDEPNEAVLAEEHQNSQTNSLIVIICAIVAFVAVFLVFEDGKTDVLSSARTLGGIIGIMIFPAIAGWIAARFTRRWGVAFAVTFVIFLSLAIAGKLYQRRIESNRAFISAATEQILPEHPIKANKDSRIYHWFGCPNYDDISPRNVEQFAAIEDAEAKGYRPARNCSTAPGVAGRQRRPHLKSRAEQQADKRIQQLDQNANLPIQ